MSTTFVQNRDHYSYLFLLLRRVLPDRLLRELYALEQVDSDSDEDSDTEEVSNHFNPAHIPNSAHHLKENALVEMAQLLQSAASVSMTSSIRSSNQPILPDRIGIHIRLTRLLSHLHIPSPDLQTIDVLINGGSLAKDDRLLLSQIRRLLQMGVIVHMDDPPSPRPIFSPPSKLFRVA